MKVLFNVKFLTWNMTFYKPSEVFLCISREQEVPMSKLTIQFRD